MTRQRLAQNESCKQQSKRKAESADSSGQERDDNVDVASTSNSKRARTVGSSAGCLSPIAIGADCHMLRAFSRDQDSWYTLLHKKLNLADLAVLYASCRTTKNWIGQPSKLLLTSKRARVVTPMALQSMAACKWVLPFLMQVKVNMRPTLPPVTLPPVTLPPLMSTLSDVVDALVCFPRLTRVGLQLCSMDAGRADMRHCFQRLTAAGLRIQHLEFLMAGVGTIPSSPAVVGEPIVPAVGAAFLELEGLPHLESFSVSNLDELPSNLNFEALARLPNLAQFGITISRGASPSGAHRSFHATAAQSKCLAQCKRLTNLRCGIWSLPMYLDHQMLAAPESAEVQQRCKAAIDAGVGALTDGKISAIRLAQKELVAVRVAPGYSASSSPDPVPSALPLQLLHLEGTVISGAVWAYLSRMHSLLSLTPYAWRSDLTADQWASLAKFRHLRDFSLLPHPLDAYGPTPIVATDFLPHLLQCSQLQKLHLQSVRIDRDQLAEIVARLSNLRHLSLRTMEVESVQPLAQAPKLQVLSMHFCTHPAAADPEPMSLPVQRRVVSFRESLPSMPHLTALLLHDRVRITAEAAAPLNAALQQRLPKLKLAAFHQNLLATTPASSLV